MKRINKKFRLNSRIITIGIIALTIILSFFVGRDTAPKVIIYKTTLDQPIKVKSQITINKQFTFPVKDSKGNTITDLLYKIETADIQDEIIINGQRAGAVKGRTFFILTIKIENSTSKNIQINSRDYVRLSLNNSSELLASDIHNDPIQVQAISTKYTRLAFPINNSDKNIILHVGEINGSKTIIPVNFPKK